MPELEERRNARIRRLREQREGPVRRRRRVQPLLLIAWIAGSVALLIIAIIVGFNVIFAPRLMSWIEDNPGAIEHGIVQDFVKWYRPAHRRSSHRASWSRSESQDNVMFFSPRLSVPTVSDPARIRGKAMRALEEAQGVTA